jgi:hypothetical protein
MSGILRLVNRSGWFVLFTLMLGMAVLLGLALPPGAMAIPAPPTSAVFNVDNNSDDPGKDDCDDMAPNDCSLRGAINRINAYPTSYPLYTINIPAGLGTINLTGGSLDIETNIKIVGPGSDQLTIDGGGIDRVFYVLGGGVPDILGDVGINSVQYNGNADISGMTITNGGGASMIGSGIFVVGGTASLTNCVVTGNQAVMSGAGGAVVDGGTLNLTTAP